MVATTGAQLLPDTAIKALCDDLLPCTFLLTPNIPEANLILEEAGRTPVDVHNVDDVRRLAREIHDLGPKYVLVKGGHVPMPSGSEKSPGGGEKVIVNVLFGEDLSDVIECPYRESKNTHGSGCSLACEVITFAPSMVKIANEAQLRSPATLRMVIKSALQSVKPASMLMLAFDTP